MSYRVVLKEVGNKIDIIPNGQEKCPKCGALGKIKYVGIEENIAGSIMVQCECGHTDILEVFIQEERPEFIAENFEEYIKRM